MSLTDSYHSVCLDGEHHTGVYDKLILGHCLHLLNQKFCSQQCKICIMQETILFMVLHRKAIEQLAAGNRLWREVFRVTQVVGRHCQ